MWKVVKETICVENAHILGDWSLLVDADRIQSLAGDNKLKAVECESGNPGRIREMKSSWACAWWHRSLSSVDVHPPHTPALMVQVVGCFFGLSPGKRWLVR